jgi:hypothetical protein
MVTSEQLERWEGMCEAATAGPLVVDSVMENTDTEIILGYEVPDAGSPILVAATFQDEDDLPGRISPREARANARLFAESRTAMPLLIHECRRLTDELSLWKPMTPEEAEKAYDEAEAVPMAPGEAEAIVEKMMASINDPLYRPTEPEYVQLVVEIRRLRKENAGLKLLHAIANHVEGEE